MYMYMYVTNAIFSTMQVTPILGAMMTKNLALVTQFKEDLLTS